MRSLCTWGYIPGDISFLVSLNSSLFPTLRKSCKGWGYLSQLGAARVELEGNDKEAEGRLNCRQPSWSICFRSGVSAMEEIGSCGHWAEIGAHTLLHGTEAVGTDPWTRGKN